MGRLLGSCCAIALLAGCGDGAAAGDGGGGAAAKPGTLPDFATLGLYDDQSPFNRPIPAGAVVDTDSAAMVQTLIDSQTLLVSVGEYSSTVFFADSSTPRRDVGVACGPAWGLGVERLAQVPIPDFAEPSHDSPGAGGPPTGCGQGSNGGETEADDHMVIFDLDTRCEYDFWQARHEGDAWVASWGNAISMDSNGIYPRGLSSRGSGFAFPGGILWPDELASGVIGHALAFSYSFTRDGGPVAPATDSDGITASAAAIPEGARVRLDPALDLDSLPLEPYERTIAEALQTYGMWLVDTSGSSDIALYAVAPASVSDDPYATVWSSAPWITLDHIPLDAFQVLELGPQDGAWESQLALVDTGCNTYQ